MPKQVYHTCNQHKIVTFTIYYRIQWSSIKFLLFIAKIFPFEKRAFCSLFYTAEIPHIVAILAVKLCNSSNSCSNGAHHSGNGCHFSAYFMLGRTELHPLFPVCKNNIRMCKKATVKMLAYIEESCYKITSFLKVGIKFSENFL